MAKFKYGACLPTFASCADRYCLSGYGGGATTVEGMLDLAATVPNLSGVELVGNWHISDENELTAGENPPQPTATPTRPPCASATATCCEKKRLAALVKCRCHTFSFPRSPKTPHLQQKRRSQRRMFFRHTAR